PRLSHVRSIPAGSSRLLRKSHSRASADHFGRVWMVSFLVAAALAAAAPAPLAPAAATNADPAMFVVRDADTTVYIFGTFHALDGQTEWFNDQVRDSFEKSDELVLETLIPEGPAGPVAFRPPLRMPTVASASFLATTRMAI